MSVRQDFFVRKKMGFVYIMRELLAKDAPRDGTGPSDPWRPCSWGRVIDLDVPGGSWQKIWLPAAWPSYVRIGVDMVLPHVPKRWRNLGSRAAAVRSNEAARDIGPRWMDRKRRRVSNEATVWLATG